MSREIRFRLWDTDKNEMIYPTIEHNEKYVLQLNCEYIGEFNGNTYDSVKMPLMQWTGKKDKNGKEIYELHEIDGAYRVVWFFNRYVLQSISNSDIFLEINENVKYEITGEYSPI